MSKVIKKVFIVGECDVPPTPPDVLCPIKANIIESCNSDNKIILNSGDTIFNKNITLLGKIIGYNNEDINGKVLLGGPNGFELAVISGQDNYTINSFLSGTTLHFTRTDLFNAYQVDLSSLKTTNINEINGLSNILLILSGDVYTLNENIITLSGDVYTLNENIIILSGDVQNKISEAPISGITYGRRDGQWVELISQIQDLDSVLNNGNISDMGILLLNNSLELISNISSIKITPSEFNLFSEDFSNVSIQENDIRLGAGFDQGFDGIIGLGKSYKTFFPATESNYALFREIRSGFRSNLFFEDPSGWGNLILPNIGNNTEIIATRDWVNNNLISLSGSVTSLSNNLNSLSGNVNSLSGNVNSLSNNLNSLSGNVNSLILNKENITVATTGTTIIFTTPLIFNLATAPATGNITNDLSGARIGVIQKIYHNDSVIPSVPGGWVLIGGEYKTSELNIIYAEWAGSSRVEYWIAQEQ